MKCSLFIVSALIVLANCKGKMQKKGFVVEVQSHQQALKLANPIADLEQTISRGMNDPYTDPRFVMNQINEEFFGNSLKSNPNAAAPLVDNNLHNRELMAFRNLPMGSQRNIGINSLSGDLFPSNPIVQHAIKNNNVANREPAQAIDEALSRLMKFKNTAKKHLRQEKIAPVDSPLDVSKLARDPRLPSNLRIAHLTSDSLHPSEDKQEDSTSRGLAGSIEVDQNAIPGEQTDAAPKSNEKASDGSVNIGDSSTNIGDTLSSLLSQSGPKSNDILPTNPGSITGKEMEENFSSIKAFIDEDDDLRRKKVIDPVRNPLEDLLHSKHKKHRVPKARKTLRKIIGS